MRRHTGGPVRGFGPGDLGVRELAEKEFERDEEEAAATNPIPPEELYDDDMED